MRRLVGGGCCSRCWCGGGALCLVSIVWCASTRCVSPNVVGMRAHGFQTKHDRRTDRQVIIIQLSSRSRIEEAGGASLVVVGYSSHPSGAYTRRRPVDTRSIEVTKQIVHNTQGGSASSMWVGKGKKGRCSGGGGHHHQLASRVRTNRACLWLRGAPRGSPALGLHNSSKKYPSRGGLCSCSPAARLHLGWAASEPSLALAVGRRRLNKQSIDKRAWLSRACKALLGRD